MRKLIMMFAVVAVFAACNNSDLETEKEVVTTDSTAMYNSNASADTATAVIPAEEPVAAEPKTITRTKTIYVDRTPKSTPQKNAPTQPQVNNGAGVPPPGTGTSTSTTGTGTSTTGTGTTTAPAEKKEGMSNATKGAVIGGVGGAVGGAIISKKKGTGAIIGGVIGAAGGYILGKKKDKKEAADTTK